jgi:hypothetical protein
VISRHNVLGVLLGAGSIAAFGAPAFAQTQRKTIRVGPIDKTFCSNAATRG